MGPTFINSKGAIEPRLLDQRLRELENMIRRGQAAASPVAPATVPPPVTAQAFQANGATPLRVDQLLGQLAQPQIPYVPTGTAVPDVNDPQSQDGSLFRLSTTNTLYRFDANPPPGAWAMLAGGLVVNVAALAFNSANQSINNTTETLLTYDSEVYDNNGIHSTASLTGRLTAATAGIYAITLNIAFAANNTGLRFASIRLNGATLIAAQITKAADDGATRTFLSVNAHYQLAIGDYVDSTAYQSSGGALNVEATGKLPNFGMALVSS